MTANGSLPRELPFVHPAPRADIREQTAVNYVISTVDPSVVFHLAAQSSVSASWEDPVGTAEATGVGTARLLSAIYRLSPSARVFVASSSEIFGHPDETPQTETTSIRPISPYGAAKAYAHHIASAFRARYGLFVAIGILFNHESPRRPPTFVTQKIVRGAVAVARGEHDRLLLGNLESRRDWGYAGDFADAIVRMILDQDEPTDFVVASGQSHSVRDWCEIAFLCVGLEWNDYVACDESLWRPEEPRDIVGNHSKATRLLGWKPSLTFSELVQLMVDSELGRREVTSQFQSTYLGST